MLRFGDVREADTDTNTYRVYLPEDDVVTFPLPAVAFSTQKAVPHTPLQVGTRVVCMFDESMHYGVILGAVFTDQEPPQQNKSADEFSVLFDGGSLTWDGQGFIMKVNEVTVTVDAEGVRIAKAGDTLERIMADMLTAVSAMTHTSAAAGSPTSPPLNAASFTALRQRVQNLLS